MSVVLVSLLSCDGAGCDKKTTVPTEARVVDSKGTVGVRVLKWPDGWVHNKKRQLCTRCSLIEADAGLPRVGSG